MAKTTQWLQGTRKNGMIDNYRGKNGEPVKMGKSQEGRTVRRRRRKAYQTKEEEQKNNMRYTKNSGYNKLI